MFMLFFVLLHFIDCIKNIKKISLKGNTYASNFYLYLIQSVK